MAHLPAALACFVACFVALLHGPVGKTTLLQHSRGWSHVAHLERLVFSVDNAQRVLRDIVAFESTRVRIVNALANLIKPYDIVEFVSLQLALRVFHFSLL